MAQKDKIDSVEQHGLLLILRLEKIKSLAIMLKHSEQSRRKIL